jgi:hypothetical protein
VGCYRKKCELYDCIYYNGRSGNILHNNKLRHLPDLSSTQVPSSTAQIVMDYAYSQTCMYLQGSPGEIQTPTHLNLIGPNMTAPKPVLSPNSILPPPSAHCAFHSREKNSARLKKMLFRFFTVSKHCGRLKLRTSGVGLSEFECVRCSVICRSLAFCFKRYAAECSWHKPCCVQALHSSQAPCLTSFASPQQWCAPRLTNL